MKKTRSRRYFARTCWTPNDVQTIRPRWSLAQCRAFLERNEHHIADRMIEQGWDILTVIINYAEQEPHL